MIGRLCVMYEIFRSDPWQFVIIKRLDPGNRLYRSRSVSQVYI